MKFCQVGSKKMTVSKNSSKYREKSFDFDVNKQPYPTASKIHTRFKLGLILAARRFQNIIYHQYNRKETSSILRFANGLLKALHIHVGRKMLWIYI